MASVSGDPVLDHAHHTSSRTVQRHYDDSSSQDTDSDQDAEDIENEHEWYYRRSREMEDEERGILVEIYRSAHCRFIDNEIGLLRDIMEQLEEDMENARISEGTYLERSDVLRKSYKQIVHYKAQSADVPDSMAVHFYNDE